MAEKKRISGLGRGLSALLDEAASPTAIASASHISLALIIANPLQPRRQFPQGPMDELIDSVAQHGILQPILVRPLPDGRYEIIAGERRWRAAQAAGLHEMPALVRDLDDRATFEIALIENIQRQDLNPVEEARGYRRLMDDYGHTQVVLSGILGKSRSHIANLLRLIELPEAVLTMVEDGTLSFGHAKALLLAEDPETLARKVVKDGLSVRATEALASNRPGPKIYKPAPPPRIADPNLESVELQIAEMIGMPVALNVASGSGTGSMTIRFDSLDQLDWLCAKLGSA